MSNEKIPDVTLRDVVLKSLTEHDMACDKVLEHLSFCHNADRPNDIIFAVLLEMELLHRVMEQCFVKNREQHKVIGNNLIAAYEEKNQKMMELVTEQQLIFRSQFRRLIALHRERFLVRVFVFAAMLLISLLAGIGVFYLYILLIK
ncbi:MAG: hypothetical protein WCS27_04235 [Victivallaceae bacterium]|jgi:hypothetical protein